MSKIDDTEYPLRMGGPLKGDLAISSFHGNEELGKLFEYRLDLFSEISDFDFNSVVGTRITLEFDVDDGVRYFNGFVTEFSYTGSDERYHHFQAVVRPWLWFLTRTSDCRIFQNQKIPDIIKSVLSDNGFSDYEVKLNGTYRNWDYCVQYRETDFNFITRLMEQEGIFFYFEHQNGKHTLVMVDDSSSCGVFKVAAREITFLPHSRGINVDEPDFLQSLTVNQSIQASKYELNDYNFTKPRNPMLARREKKRPHPTPLSDSEYFDYPGEYQEQADGQKYAAIRLEEVQSQFERIQVSGPCRWLAAGSVFTLTGHPREDQNREYLNVATSWRIVNGGYESGTSETYEYHFTAELIDKKEPFRSARTTPKPLVQGCQTAVVVGHSRRTKDDIYCDPYGRIKVQFHWDRHGKIGKPENSSCWIRVSQVWAGKEWGGLHIPRVGQEVIVSFLEGDPDQPIVTGRVYNEDNKPVYSPLDSNHTQSGIKSRSTPDGNKENFNEIRMEDKIGEEELYLHAERNQTNITENDYTVKVGYEKKDKGSYTFNVHQDRTELVSEGDYSLEVAKGNKRVKVEAGKYSIKVRGDKKLKVEEGNYKIEVLKGNYSLKADHSQAGEVKIKAQRIKVEGSQEIELVIPGHSIKLDPSGISIKSSGFVQINGKLVKIN